MHTHRVFGMPQEDQQSYWAAQHMRVRSSIWLGRTARRRNRMLFT